ncbi:uncharacterized protein LOC120314367 [Crotalus tigris]|uniref:uncharacterized protein LOC120314367 n=1 Tax=Crotalus tigris TaxID=88082 RepID=UPI00192F8116|nr:uncharacterized protein LOC120314367 [Crotalus tigris]
MAEGVQGADAMEDIQEQERDLGTSVDPGAALEGPVVRPKERSIPPVLGVDPGMKQQPALPETVEWGLSSTLQRLDTEGRVVTTDKGPAEGWRERRAVSGEEGDWSYSTTPGQYTLDVLKARFGEPGFLPRQGAIPRRPTESPGFRLASPLLRGPTVQSDRGGHGAARLGPMAATQASPAFLPLGPGDLGQRTNIAEGQHGGQPVAWPTGIPWTPPPIGITFDGDPDKLAMFLGHVLNHLDRFAAHYSSQWAIVVAVTASLQGEAASWAADLFGDHASELADIGANFGGLR